MYIKSLNSTVVILLISSLAFSQEKNPYESIGKKGKVITLTNDKYEELFDQNDVQQIGTALVNIRTSEVVKLLSEKEAEKRLDNTASSRFLSVDPLTKMYPMLTPYQYASNRPIDGIDLDGKEWVKMETFDPMTGTKNVKFEVKLKIVNESKVFNDAQSLTPEIQRQFAEAFKQVQDKTSNVTYSASISVEYVNQVGDNDFGVLILDGAKPDPGFVPVAGVTSKVNTKENTFHVTGSKFRGDEQIVKPAKLVAQDIVHELIHTAGVFHPQDDGNTAEDVDLVPTYAPDGRFNTYILGKRANLDLILSNIMVYPEVKIDGKKVREQQPDTFKRNKVSPNQAKIAAGQIDKDEKKDN